MGHYMDDVVDLCPTLDCDGPLWRDGHCRFCWWRRRVDRTVRFTLTARVLGVADDCVRLSVGGDVVVLPVDAID